MTVNPGFGGQHLIAGCLDKIARLRQLLDARGLANVALQADGGVNLATIAATRAAGASVAVVGSAIYAPGRPVAAAIAALNAAMDGAANPRAAEL
jgi:ribulose-phosphate 3-epimerase